MRVRWNELTGIFLAACGTLLFEVSTTKIFEFSLWSNYAFLVVSTAMFGLGFAGVFLTRWPRFLESRSAPFLAACSAASGLTMATGFFVMNYVPIHLPDAPNGWPSELLGVAVVFTALAVPFFFFGLLISYLFERRGEQANVYYFADLVGAGLGSFLLVPLISSIAPQGLVLLSVVLGLAAALLFALDVETGRARTVPAVAAGLALLAAIAWFGAPLMAGAVPLNVHVNKRSFKQDVAGGRIEATGWSPLSRVDIAVYDNTMKRVWISGGVNESAIRRFNGDFAALRPRREESLANAARGLDYIVLPHLLKVDHTVAVIGTSGGSDSLRVLQTGARKVTGIEMDATISRFVTRDYREYAGGLFTDGDYSELVIDEGRSYLRRSGRKFDVIQQVNNFTPIAFANGALNLSENYLLTVESFRDFWDHLTDDGILCINRHGSIRLLSTDVEMLRQLGMKPEEYSRHLLVARGPQDHISTLMLKKSPFTREEVDRIFAFYEVTNNTRYIHYAPYRTDELADRENNLYSLIATAPDPAPYLQVGPYRFTAPTDEKPFFNHFKTIGASDRERDRLPRLPAEVLAVDPPNKVRGRIPKGDLPPLVVLLEAALMATVFFGLPLLSRPDLRASLRGHGRALGYFACLGVGFIFVEICLIQRLVLFLGAPVYSIAIVFGCLLIAAGLGSFASGAIAPGRRGVRALMFTVAACILAAHYLMPALTDAFLGSTFPVRVAVAAAITSVLGFVMGMPMPTGIRYLKASGKNIVSWAWATNGYFTVVGSALTVVIAVNFGFVAVFMAAAAIYAVAPWFLAGENPGA
jgi:hypothetical protein